LVKINRKLQSLSQLKREVIQPKKMNFFRKSNELKLY
jgi:hypothetical protein